LLSGAAKAYSVKYRYSANICQLEVEPPYYGFLSVQRLWNGLEVFDFDNDEGSGNTDWIICPLPTGTTLVEAANDNGVILHKVRVNGKYSGPSGESIEGLLEFHDDNSASFCTCDDDEWIGSFGEFYLDLSYAGDSDSTGCSTGCSGIQANWLMNVEIGRSDLYGTSGNRNGLDLHSINVYQ